MKVMLKKIHQFGTSVSLKLTFKSVSCICKIPDKLTISDVNDIEEDSSISLISRCLSATCDSVIN